MLRKREILYKLQTGLLLYVGVSILAKKNIHP
jgi:hypothetical protein